MAHCIEAASSGRSSCRGCGDKIPKAELRFGERVDNPFGDGEATYWFHLQCAALMRPEPFLPTLEASDADMPDRGALTELARVGGQVRRLPRLMRAERAPSGRARCRSCRELIEKEAWRLSLAMFEDGRMNPIGFIHVPCAGEYFGTAELIERLDLLHSQWPPADRSQVSAQLGEQPAVKKAAASAGPGVSKVGEAEKPEPQRKTKL